MSAQVQVELIPCKGGLDQITPTLSLANSFARNALNFEAAVTGGYNRIAGYERFDGMNSPSDFTASVPFVPVGAITGCSGAAVVGDAIVFSGGSTGVVAAVIARPDSFFTTTNIVAINDLSGPVVAGGFPIGETCTIGSTVTGGRIVTLTTIAGNPTPEDVAIFRSSCCDVVRTYIGRPNGVVGPVRGVVEFKDVVYSFVNNATDTAVIVFKSTSSGWESVPYLKQVAFTGGYYDQSVKPDDGPAELYTLKQGVVTTRIRRVVRESGSWQAMDTTGRFVIDTLAGGNFIAGVVELWTNDTIPVLCGAADLTGAQTDIALAPHTASTTKFEFEERNFYGQEATTRLYGCDGVNQAFEFDGEILVPISTGAGANDKPTHLATHKGYLFLSIGSSIIHSAPGLPYCFDALENAGELATGGDITGLISMPGGTNTATLGVTTRTNTLILYGTGVSDWNLTPYNTGTGARDWTLQNMTQTYVFDDRGVQSIQATLQYGNFDQTTLTNAVLPFINQRINKVTCATLCRRKSQYRVFFDDGFALFITIVNGKLLGCMPAYFPNPVHCVYEGKRSSGEDVIFFGSTNGYVYQMEKGTSFDGEAIDFNLTMNYSNQRSPRTLKRYRKCVPEISAPSGTFVKLDMTFALGYDSNEYSQYGSDNYDRYVGNTRWDTLTWDNTFWDTSGTNMVEAYMEGTAENVAVLVSGSYDYVPEFTLNSFLLHYSPRRMMR